MVDQEMLQAMSEMMDAKFQAQRKEIMHDVTVLMDADFKPKFNLLAEDIGAIHEQLGQIDKKLERIEDKVAVHEIKLKVME